MLDGCVCTYNILPTAGSSAGAKHTDETKEKISASKKGQNSPYLNQGKAVYLYIVRGHVLELAATYFNRKRASESLGVDRTTLFRYIKNRSLFKVNGLPHIVSAAGLAIIYSRRPTLRQPYLNFPRGPPLPSNSPPPSPVAFLLKSRELTP